MNVEDLMSHSVKACPSGATLEAAAQIMLEKDCGVVPVVDQNGCVVSVVTDRDICLAALKDRRPLSELSVDTACSKKLVVAHPQDPLKIAEELMREHQIRRIPVVDDDGGLVGMLSLSDLARHSGRRADDLGTIEISRTLGAICEAPSHKGARMDRQHQR
jgi:CBS domain-containing protein